MEVLIVLGWLVFACASLFMSMISFLAILLGADKGENAVVVILALVMWGITIYISPFNINLGG